MDEWMNSYRHSIEEIGSHMSTNSTFDTNRYIDTRGNVSKPISFSHAILNGLAPGGGLYVPEHIPHFDTDDLVQLAHVPYWQAASSVYQAFGIDFEASEIDALMQKTYGSNFDTDEICKVVPLKKSGNEEADSSDAYVLELWHGPTSAFKDMALQCLPQFFSASIAKHREKSDLDHDFLILVATSGDTGGAALAGFADTPHVKIGVMYPDGGVSDIQHLQMTTQQGSNVMVWAVRGNFDDCQNVEKQAFGDPAFNDTLLDTYGYSLSSANSINWGRLLPQIVYYLVACGRLMDAGVISPQGVGNNTQAEAIDVCVPTGNFGDILAAWYAKQMGAPIAHLICASNENRVLSDFINTGTYDISNRPFIKTPSPAMDILISSNLERLLFELTGRNGAKVSGWMDDLARDRKFSVDKQTFARIREDFSSDSATNYECLQTLGKVYDSYHYLIDPHTAVAWNVAERLRSDRPLLVASTANWAKFGENVYRGLHGIKDGAPLPPHIAKLDGCALNDLIHEETGAEIPQHLAALKNAKVRFTDVLDGNLEKVEHAIYDFAQKGTKKDTRL